MKQYVRMREDIRGKVALPVQQPDGYVFIV